jgi:serine/threonine protein phosphatase 1
LLQKVEPRAEDRIVFLGDYIDRGPASREVVESMVQLRSTCSPVFLRGNHEVMILDAREDVLKANLWQSYGGLEALISYGAEYNPHWPALIPNAHWDFFARTARCFETKDHIFVHACLDPEADTNEQPDWLLYLTFWR